uniref:Uncharacterized protein n=1 Tax=Anguilla anguilla TaxID=7936 RepID=A0A0E9UEK5_ANGAN
MSSVPVRGDVLCDTHVPRRSKRCVATVIRSQNPNRNQDLNHTTAQP